MTPVPNHSGALSGSWLAQYPPGSGTKAQLCRKHLQFPLPCVTNALLCLLPKPQPHGSQCSGGIFPLTKTHKQCSSSSLLKNHMSLTFAVMASMNQALSQHLSQSIGTDNGQLLSKPAQGRLLLVVVLFVVVASKEKHLFRLSFGSFISDQIESNCKKTG